MSGQHMLCGYTGQRNESHPRQRDAGLHQAAQNSMQLKTYELLVSGVFPFLDVS